MKPLSELLTLRPSVHDATRRDQVHDLTNLAAGTVNAGEFFAENFVTEGMRQLLREGFRRLAGQSEQGVYVLSQAMGGGKTHNMIALGLLAQHPDLRAGVMGADYTAGATLGKVRVVSFTGRENDAPLGVWGAIADQLGKKEFFKDYYSPLQAPGQSAWMNLLKGEPVLILLDELPPYFEAARSKQIGNSDLSRVTATALANLLVAVSKPELANVCVVLSDLKASYEGGGQTLNEALHNFENEVGRGALELRPVALNSREIYDILRTRLFANKPADAEVKEVCAAYAKEVKDARQMDLTSAQPDELARQMAESWPFHPALRDLYARFRENKGFQQTRALIRLMRAVTSRLWHSGKAAQQSAIHPYDVDLNDEPTLREVRLVNTALDNAVAHDIASHGQSVAEQLDKTGPVADDAQDAAKLFYMASLANVPGAILGLSLSEAVAALCRPGRDTARLPKDVLGVLQTRAWYLHADREGRLFFKNTENVVAKLHTIATSYTREIRLKELAEFLKKSFEPKIGDCYQTVLALPAVDDISLTADKVTLVISEPYPDGGLDPALLKFWEDTTFQNRIAFLSGDRDTMSRLLDTSAEAKAIHHILAELQSTQVPASDPQVQAAQSIRDGILLRLLHVARETFTRLHYPHGDKLLVADFMMNFTGNQYQGEAQIRDTLAAKHKFTTDTASATFQAKCEQRLFTQQVMPWADIRRRAAVNTQWNWHIPSALESLKADLLMKDRWRQDGDLMDKGPFPPPVSSVRVQELKRNDDTGEVTLRLTPVHADKVHFEIGSPATAASSPVPDLHNFTSAELRLSFLAVDSTGAHPSGPPEAWKNRITIKSRFFQDGDQLMCELHAAPPVPVRYTTDGSDPLTGGGSYGGPFAVPKDAILVLAAAEKDGVKSDLHRTEVPRHGVTVTVDPKLPAIWKRSLSAKTTKETYEFLDRLKKCKASVRGLKLEVAGKHWLDLNAANELELDADRIGALLKLMRETLGEGEASLSAQALCFTSGADLNDWVTDVKTQIKTGEVHQFTPLADAA